MDGAVLSVWDPSVGAGVGRRGTWLAGAGVAVCVCTDEVLVTDAHNHRVVPLTWSPASTVRLLFFVRLPEYACLRLI